MSTQYASVRRYTNITPQEQQRISSIEHFAAQGAFISGYEAIIEAAKADGHSTPGDVAIAIIAEIKRENAWAALSSGSAHAPRAAGGDQPQGGRFPDLEAVEAAAARDWSSNPNLRAEFAGHKGSYIALCKAEARGVGRTTRRRQ